MTVVANLQEDRYLETTCLEIEAEQRAHCVRDAAADSSTLKNELVAYREARSTTVGELSPADLHPWVKRLLVALSLVVAANCIVGLGVAGYELAEAFYWAFIGLLTVTTMTTLYLAK